MAASQAPPARRVLPLASGSTAAVPAAAVQKPTGSAQLTLSAPAGNTIIVTSVDTAIGDGRITGVIAASSSRGLALDYTVVSQPGHGGTVTLGPPGEFTLVPGHTAITSGMTEQFGVAIRERTPVQALLERIPVVGGLVPEIFAALRRIPIVNGLLSPIIGYGVVAQLTIDVGELTSPGGGEPGPVPVPANAAAGWNLYSWQASDHSVVAAVNRQKPGLVRWFVEMDRFLEDETQPFWPSRPWSWAADTSFDPFFESLADNDTTLVIALWNKDHWAKSMRACESCGWPKIDQFAAFVADLDAKARDFGVTVIFEAQNEPDLRWGSLGAATNIGATENFTDQWYAGLPRGWAQYRGGTGSLWQQMNQVVDEPFASGGIISLYTAEITLSQRLSGNYPTTKVSTSWIDATAPLVDFTSFHKYGLANTSVGDYVDWVYNEWSIWKKAKGFGVPFYIGEIGPTPTGSAGFTNADAAKMREIHAALAADPRFEGSYLGMTAHVFSSTDAPNPWETSKGWWDPAFTVAEVVD